MPDRNTASSPVFQGCAVVKHECDVCPGRATFPGTTSLSPCIDRRDRRAEAAPPRK